MNDKLTTPYRLEFAVEVPGTPEQVWDAIATGKGMSAWFLPARLEERPGGALRFDMGPEMGSDGEVVEWDAPHRIVYQEDWAALMGVDADLLSPMTSEFVVEAKSGGTCVVRVTTSGFGTGAEWEAQWWDSMGVNWKPYFDNLRLYLTEFAGQEATHLEASASHTSDGHAVWAAMRSAAGLGEQGSDFALRDVTGTVEHLGDLHALIHLTAPVPGMLTLSVFEVDEADTFATIRAYLFGADAEDYVQREQLNWQAWLEALPAGA